MWGVGGTVLILLPYNIRFEKSNAGQVHLESSLYTVLKDLAIQLRSCSNYDCVKGKGFLRIDEKCKYGCLYLKVHPTKMKYLTTRPLEDE